MKVIIGTFGSNDSDHDDLIERNLEINLNLFHRENNLILKYERENIWSNRKKWEMLKRDSAS